MSLLLVWALSADPAIARARVEWTAPPECPPAAEVQAELDRLVDGRSIREDVVAVATVEADDEGLRATLEIAEWAPRSLHAGECRALARAVALVIAVAVDPVAVAGRLAIDEGEPPGPSDAASTADEGLVTPPVEDEVDGALGDDRVVDASPRRRPSIGHSLGLGGGVLYGVAPAVTGAIAGSYRLDRGPLRIEARAAYATPLRVDYPDGVGALLQAVTVGALACAVPALPRLRAPICAGVEGGPIIAVGRGSATVERRASLWASALLGLSLVAQFRPRLAITVGGELAIALRRPAFHVGAREILSRAPQVGGRGLVGLEIRLDRPTRRAKDRPLDGPSRRSSDR